MSAVTQSCREEGAGLSVHPVVKLLDVPCLHGLLPEMTRPRLAALQLEAWDSESRGAEGTGQKP